MYVCLIAMVLFLANKTQHNILGSLNIWNYASLQPRRLLFIKYRNEKDQSITVLEIIRHQTNFGSEMGLQSTRLLSNDKSCVPFLHSKTTPGYIKFMINYWGTGSKLPAGNLSVITYTVHKIRKL